jgi:23S rRNA pseudouridine2457 synthase
MSTGQRYFILNKPYDMLSQFIGPHPVRKLGDLDFDFPPGTHPIGRLDAISEGLLILTTDKTITKALFQSKKPHQRKYLVQVYKVMSPETLQQLRTGVTISSRGSEETYTTAPCEVTLTEKPLHLFHSGHEFNDRIPHTWFLISMTEGKFRQIRKMVKAVGHRCQRLIRLAIEDLELEDLQPGEVREMEEKEFFEKLKIENW